MANILDPMETPGVGFGLLHLLAMTGDVMVVVDGPSTSRGVPLCLRASFTPERVDGLKGPDPLRRPVGAMPHVNVRQTDG